MDKQLVKYVGILVGLVVLLMIFLLLKNSFTGGTKYTNDKIEEKLVAAAKKYVNDKAKNGQDILPDAPGTSYSIAASILVNEGYIKDLSSLSKENVTCNGDVVIWNAGNGNYDYVPELTCGNYTTEKLVERVVKDNDYGVTYGSGLYQRIDGVFITNDGELGKQSENFEYVFRGDDVNNFVKIDDNIWRIVAIDRDDNMLLILENNSQKSYTWDDKYNDEIKKYQGINTYEENGLESNAYKVVREFYDGTITLMNREKLSKKLKHILVPMTLCIGKRSLTDTTTDGSAECATILEDEYVGLLPAYYYMSASLDSGCTSITSKNCGNYNYLSSFDDYWWLLTANSENTNEAYAISKKSAVSNLCSYKSVIRPIVKVGSRLIYNEGNGSRDNPYTIKYFSDED